VIGKVAANFTFDIDFQISNNRGIPSLGILSFDGPFGAE